jgi:preprotein translocase subunit SecE
MARNRQRAKQRQEERRAARKAGGSAVPNSRTEAPPEELGRSDYTLDHTVEEEEFIGDLQVGDDRLPDDEDLLPDDDGVGTEVAGPRGVRGGRAHEEHEHHERGRVMGFLHAVWLELGRVQWPDRNQLTSLTGITLMFVLIVGGYLGLLDAIFSKLVSAIL